MDRKASCDKNNTDKRVKKDEYNFFKTMENVFFPRAEVKLEEDKKIREIIWQKLRIIRSLILQQATDKNRILDMDVEYGYCLYSEAIKKLQNTGEITDEVAGILVKSLNDNLKHFRATIKKTLPKLSLEKSPVTRQLKTIQQIKKDRNILQKRIENSIEINEKIAKSYKRADNRNKTKVIREKYNFGGFILNKVQKRHLKLHGLESFYEKYPQYKPK